MSLTDQELIDKADRWINNSELQNWKTDQRSISFISSLLLQSRKGQRLTERQKDYMWAILMRCSNESQA